MKIKQLTHRLLYIENGKQISLIGYAFLDKNNHTMIIVYGENRMELLKRYYERF